MLETLFLKHSILEKQKKHLTEKAERLIKEVQKIQDKQNRIATESNRLKSLEEQKKQKSEPENPEPENSLDLVDPLIRTEVLSDLGDRKLRE